MCESVQEAVVPRRRHFGTGRCASVPTSCANTPTGRGDCVRGVCVEGGGWVGVEGLREGGGGAVGVGRWGKGLE